jgi:YVTN family beta-propeller protein
MTRSIVCAVALLVATAAQAAFTTFETGQVRPMAMSPDGTRLFAVNTPGDYLEIFSIDGSGGLVRIGSVPVGLEPIAVAARSNSEVWVVNHLSDSVSIVDVGTSPPRVVRTLLVGDEPRDIVFAGTGGNRAFITTAHRGQNRGADPQLTTAGVGRADVWVFDANSLGSSLGGTPLSMLTLFCDTPRALAVSPNGNTVYAAAFHSGNETTTVSEAIVCDGGSGGPRVQHLGRDVSRRPAGAEHELPGQSAARGRSHRPAEPDDEPLRGRARPQLGQRGQVQPARQGRLLDRREQPRGHTRRVRPRRHGPLQHGRQPGEREALRLEHRGAGTRSASRAGRVRRPHRRGPPARGAHQRHLGHDGHAAPSEQAPRLRRHPVAGGRQGEEPRDADGHGGDDERARRCYVAAFGSSKVGVFDVGQLEGKHVRTERVEPHHRHRRRAERRRAERGEEPALRLHALRQRRVDRQHDDRDGRSVT